MELWDVYDENGNKTGRFHTRGKPMAPGDYHMGAIIVVVNSKKEILCTLRSREKKFSPGVWENTGGGVLAGETSLTAAVRELKEETGIAANPEELVYLYKAKVTEQDGTGLLNMVYGLRRDMDAKNVVLQPGETEDARWFPHEEWEQKARAAEILSPAGQNWTEKECSTKNAEHSFSEAPGHFHMDEKRSKNEEFFEILRKFIFDKK